MRVQGIKVKKKLILSVVCQVVQKCSFNRIKSSKIIIFCYLLTISEMSNYFWGRLLKYSCLKPKTKVPFKVKLVYLILVVCEDNVIYFYLYFKTSLKCKVVLTFAIFFSLQLYSREKSHLWLLQISLF